MKARVFPNTTIQAILSQVPVTFHQLLLNACDENEVCTVVLFSVDQKKVVTGAMARKYLETTGELPEPFHKKIAIASTFTQEANDLFTQKNYLIIERLSNFWTDERWQAVHLPARK